MADFVYTTVPGKISQLFKKIKEVGVPSKADVQWRKTIGFTSSNDQSLINVLKFLNFIDGSGAPTETWRKYRASNQKVILASAIKQGYADLFSVYHDADKRSQSELSSFFTSRSSAGQQAIAKTIATFKASC